MNETQRDDIDPLVPELQTVCPVSDVVVRVADGGANRRSGERDAPLVPDLR